MGGEGRGGGGGQSNIKRCELNRRQGQSNIPMLCLLRVVEVVFVSAFLSLPIDDDDEDDAIGLLLLLLLVTLLTTNFGRAISLDSKPKNLVALPCTTSIDGVG